jgi:dienelactone hydrolase
MSQQDLSRRDPLTDFDCREFTLLGKSKRVFVAGAGPAVVVMSEMPGINPYVARFARWVRDAGFTVYMPNLFGDPGSPINKSIKTFRTIAGACVAGQFHVLRSNSSGPIADWLRALAKHAHREAGGRGVGAIGMCFTGNFALSMMLEPSVLAPVLAQPSLPLLHPSGMHIAPDELRQVRQRLDEEDLTVLGYRFEGDPVCPAARFHAYQQALGDRFCPTEIPDAAANPDALMKKPHSVLTQHLIDEEGEPTLKARDDIIAFFNERLT